METNRLILGITGGIGSGKSVVCRLLKVMGVPVYTSDTESRELMVHDAEIRRELVRLLGEEVYAGGSLNKPLLAAYLFDSAENAARVNGIVHPRVKAHFRQWVQRQQSPVVAMESAILIESGFTDMVDRVVMVYAPASLRLERSMQRDAAPREAIERRMKSQMDDEAKRSLSHFIIMNDGQLPLIPQVEELLKGGLVGQPWGSLRSGNSLDADWADKADLFFKA